MSFHLRVVTSSHPRFLSIVRAAVGQFTLVYGLTEESCRGVTLAVDEALANIIRHAYKNRDDQEIEVNLRRTLCIDGRSSADWDGLGRSWCVQ
jgi:serine/threonine-protein kinase RsbW